jgi:hypothetical protein
MKLKMIVILVVVFLLTAFIVFFKYGVNAGRQGAPILAKVNGYEISAHEFKEGFGVSAFAAREDVLQAQKEYLDILINQKLILLDAQKRNLDKTPDFLKSVENFWAQSLLTVAMGQKTMELRRGLTVRDEDVRRIYENMRKEGVTDKPLNEVFSQIKWQAEKQLETQLLNGWVVSLRKAAAVHVDEDLLKSLK